MPAPIARTLPVMAEDDSGTTDTVSPPFVTKATASRGGKDGCIPKNGAGGRARGCARIARAGAGLEMRPILTLDVARKIVDGCLNKAQQQGWKMHVAMLDIGGN